MPLGRSGTCRRASGPQQLWTTRCRDRHPSRAGGDEPARRVAFRVPELATTGLVEVRTPTGASNAAPARRARTLSGLHPVTSPAVSRSGMIYATISGQRGKQTPVSVVRVSPDGRGTPFVTGIMNATGLAFNPDGDLFVTSRAEGNVYRIDSAGESTVYAEGMGVATGAAFDRRETCLSATAAAPSSRSIRTARSLSTPRWSPASRLTTSPSTAQECCSSPAPRSPPTTQSGPSTPTAKRAPGIAASAARRGWRSPRRQHLRRGLPARPPRNRPRNPKTAKPAWCWRESISSAWHSRPSGTAVLATNEAVYDVDLGVEGMNLF